MQNLRGQMFQLIGSETSTVHTISLVGYVLSLIALAWLWWTYRKLCIAGSRNSAHLRESFRFLAAFSILIFIAFSLHTHIQDYLFATISCIWLWHYSNRRKAEGTQTFRLKFISFCCAAYPVTTWMFLYLNHAGVFTLLHTQPYFVFACLMIVLCAVDLPRILRTS
jgi:hypothetical protein